MTPVWKLEWADFDQEPTDGVVQGPLWDDVRSILEHLAGCESGFVILSRGEAFMQTAFREGDPDEGFVVEHREGEQETHVEVDEGHIPVERVVALFRAFYGSGRRPEAPWTPVSY